MSRLISAVLITAVLSGCASITGNTTQPVSVATMCGDQPVQGAQCRIINANGSWTIPSTPGSVMIRKASSDLAIDCKLDKTQAIPVQSESVAGPGAWGNLIAGGLVGFTVDGVRDAAWRYDSSFVVDMCKGIPARMSSAIQGSVVGAAASADAPLANMTTVVGGEQRYAFSAEALAKQQQCTSSPHAVLNARGPATEVYTVACNSGNTMMLKCTFGECKSI